jgi:hypothetical protein
VWGRRGSRCSSARVSPCRCCTGMAGKARLYGHTLTLTLPQTSDTSPLVKDVVIWHCGSHSDRLLSDSHSLSAYMVDMLGQGGTMEV